MLKKQPIGQNLNKKHHSILLSILESISLPAFLVYIELIEKSSSNDWLGPYFLSTALGLFSTGVLLFLNKPLNRIFMGINLYFLSGLIGVAGGIAWLNQLYGDLAASGMLAWVALACVGSMALTGGLLGQSNPQRHHKLSPKTKHLNLGFIALAIICTGLSLLLQGNRFLSEIAPFITLFTAYGVLKGKAEAAS